MRRVLNGPRGVLATTRGVPQGVSAAPGCETDTARSVAHCGACGRRCAERGGVARCEASVCAVTCDPGYGDCDGDAANGCEAALARDVAHCGACGRRCAPAHAAGDCAAGRCAVGACEAGFGDCDGDAANGCEAALTDDAAHCGACGRRCVRAGATAACAAGRCGLGRCADGRGDCDGDEANGCERDVTADARHCGACGRACGAGEVCVAGACACRAGLTACDGACADLQSDPRRCGACGRACASGICSEGICTSAAAQRSCVTAGTPGCGLVEVPGGTFTLGAETPCAVVRPELRQTCGWDDATPAQPGITVSDFAVDAYEVTVARFRAFVRARPQALAGIRARPVVYPSRSVPWARLAPLPDVRSAGCDVAGCTWTPTPGLLEAHPIVDVDLWAAQEFCVWDGGRLPTEAEWEYVAQGRSVPAEGLTPGRAYPWGNATPTAFGVCDRAHMPRICSGEAGSYLRAVGRFPASGGVYDLAGNAVEHCIDDFDGFGPRSAGCWRGLAQRDPLCYLASRSAPNVIRGPVQLVNDPVGMALRTTVRDLSANRNDVGFRCVRSRP